MPFSGDLRENGREHLILCLWKFWLLLQGWTVDLPHPLSEPSFRLSLHFRLLWGGRPPESGMQLRAREVLCWSLVGAADVAPGLSSASCRAWGASWVPGLP